jgi:hypothetical protein
MKHIIKLFAIVLLFQSFQCEKDEEKNNQTTKQVQLTQEKQIILDYIASFECDASIGCDFLAFGSKPCGGPWGYLVFSNAVDITYLTNKINNYNELEHQYNIETGAISDCMAVSPPEEVGCVNGVCDIIQ